MTPFQIFGLQTALSLIVFALLAWWYVWPRLRVLPLREALIPLLFLHAFRHIALTLLVTMANHPGVPPDFAQTLAYGDLTAGLLAILALVSLRLRWPFALIVVWVFSVWGLLDLINVAYQAIRVNATAFDLGPTWDVATMIVPALYVTHFMIFALLLRRPQKN
jgi:hypothetical protein